ncbi:hypothetical protein [Polyangium aurulentum]|uniref:hypothetical protein n=1 Tax=Polyangium aurulentum TaxID=2567896 RepID=UPI0010AEE440|nr:hypothetical protein [Polyangium aurulentum]UQA61677.1 hypothetical protein E8A73_014880 [Polyangium aurulentum]
MRSPVFRLLVVVSCFVLLASFASSARAAPEQRTWEWRQHDLRQVALGLHYRQEPGLEGCEGEAEIRSTLTGIYGYDIFTPPPPSVLLVPLPYTTIEVTIAPSGERIHATVRFLDDTDRPGYPARFIEEEPDRCTALLREVALAVHLANTATTPALAQASPPGDEAPSPPVPAPSDTPQEPWRARFNPSADIVVALGLAPGVAIGPATTAKLRVGDVWLALGFSALFPVEGPGEQKVLSTGLLLVSGGPCVRGSLVYGCALASAGVSVWRGANPKIVTRDDLTLLGLYSVRAGIDVPIVRGARTRTLTIGGYLEGGLHAFTQTQNLVTASNTEQVSPPWPLFAVASLSATMLF